MTRPWARCTILSLLVAAACTGGERDHGEPEAAAVVDSALPIPVLLDRFRSDLIKPAGFSGGARSMDALVTSYLDALERSDTAAFPNLTLTRAEFAWLYYPVIPESKPPYELQPGLMWFMLETNSGRGLRAALLELGGRPLGASGYRCENERTFEDLTLWGPCLVRLVSGEDTTEQALFGPIVERAGVYKFVSFANKF